MSSALSSRNKMLLSFLAGAGTLAGAGIVVWNGYRSRAYDRRRAPAAAFADEGPHPDAFDQTRDAGPEHMRDEQSDWDAHDQASDESFPSSDPPAANNFHTPEPIDYSKVN